MAAEGLTPGQLEKVRQSFIAALKPIAPSVKYTASDARRGSSFYTFGVGGRKTNIGASEGRSLRQETGSFL